MPIPDFGDAPAPRCSNRLARFPTRPSARSPASLTGNEESCWRPAVKAEATAGSPNSDASRGRGTFWRTGGGEASDESLRVQTPQLWRWWRSRRTFTARGEKLTPETKLNVSRDCYSKTKMPKLLVWATMRNKEQIYSSLRWLEINQCQ